jgi:hypothetical protein
VFSRRANWQPAINRLTAAREERIRRGDRLIDLTISNPTKAGIAYPDEELAAALARGARARYEPQPLGLRAAREAVAANYMCDPDDIVITASTSEAYSYLFKLLTDPGDEIANAVPSYPLLEHLATLELITLRTFPLEFHRRWELHAPQPSNNTRAIAVVSPNNPTGSFVTDAEFARLASLGIPLVVDEVFREYALESGHAGTPPDSVLSFSLGGLSKSAGLPHYKLGWIRVGGPRDERRRAIDALELIADNYLSVATAVQTALPDLLAIGTRIRGAILDRVRGNLHDVRSAARSHPSIHVLPVEGGWTVVLRIPATRSDEDFALGLLDRGVIIHPGYFFDFPADGFVVLSLLTPPDDLRNGFAILAEAVSR